MSEIKKLDTIFSQFVRLRDTDDNGYGRCITCGETFHYKEFECGHFRSRRNLTTRWREENAHAQCFECNRKEDIGAYMIAMLNLHGMDVAADIIAKSKVDYKFIQDDYEQIYKHYRAKVKELLKDKMFKVNY